MNDPLQEKFPDMTPVSGPPALTTVNGIGFSAYGRRDFDAETGTYVKTQCFCILFIPLFAVKAYRVADAPAGWYFLGRVPLSALAKAWNLVFPLLLAVGIGIGLWVNHTRKPEYQMGRKVAEADRLAADGQLGAAAELYRQVVHSREPNHSPAALRKLGELLDSAAAKEQPAEAARVLRIAIDLDKAGPQIDRLFGRGQTLAQHQADKDPKAALQLIDLVAYLAPDGKELDTFRFPLLQKLVAKNPDDLDLISELALIHESRREFDRCEKLLGPHGKKLGDREGARILGQLYAHKGKFDQAYPLLAPYAEERLKRYQQAEQNWLTANQDEEKNVIEELKKGQASGFDYGGYDRADKATQRKMVNEYLNNRLKDHPRLKAAQADIQKENRVVPVALDLGMVLLHRAQGQADADDRRQDLEKAEKTFIAVRGAAGQIGGFRLGQVYYWLGKQVQGRKLFDEFLAGEGNSGKATAEVVQVLRQVGAVTEAKALAEQGFEKELDVKTKYYLAGLRAVMSYELEEKILWLKRGDPDDPANQADLHSTLGLKELQASQDGEAAQHFRKAIALYENQRESFVTLNNRALVHFELYQVTGESQEVAKGLALLEKALSQRQEDTILLHNIADQLLVQGLGDVAGKHIDLGLLREMGRYHHLEFLYQDRAGRDKLVAQVAAHPSFAKARQYFERLQLMAPKKARVWGSLAGMYTFLNNKDGLVALNKRLEATPLDLDEIKKLTLEEYQGKNDDKRRQELPARTKRLEKELHQARKVGGPTLAVALFNWINLKFGAARLGDPVNHDELVALAEEGHKAAPSRGSRNQVINTLLFRAHRDLSKQEPAFAALAEQGKRSVGTNYLIAIALAEEGPARKACLAHADVQRVLALLKKDTDAMPEQADEWTWAMLRPAHPEQAARVAKAYLQDPILQTSLAISRKTAPLSADIAYRHFWALQTAGQEAQAREILQRLADQGVPLPRVATKEKGQPKK